jgi:hypothetical protein
MKSPFPGMDPYLERSWGDVHQAVITYVRDWIQSRLPADLRARMQERVYIELPNAPRAVYYPDVRVVERPGLSPSAGASMAVAEPSTGLDAANGDPVCDVPFLVHIDIEPVTEGYIEIIDVKSGHRVVTAIEVLSPTNKRPGEGQQLYLKKREDQLAAGVNTVEIDLLRGGTRVLMVDAEHIPPFQGTAYQMCVWRASRRSQVEVYSVPLAARLPVIAIPLRPDDRDVPLDLPAILALCYRNGGYDDIDYAGEPDPPLSTKEAAWADALLREQGKR